MRILAIIMAFLCLPIGIMIAFIIFITSGGNAIFKQIRVGRNRVEFVIYKFKTMENNQVTKVGGVLRKLGLDELPQLINIVKGDMAFVGPRPLTNYDIQRLGWNNSIFDRRWSVKPGITGKAQLSKVCNAHESMENDLWYVANKSFVVDLGLITTSIFVPLIGKRTK
jgi:lipopolysaccharide/colanic/teichoic acid biosynthesis glycosyltransferase